MTDEFIPSPDIDEIILESPNNNETEGLVLMMLLKKWMTFFLCRRMRMRMEKLKKIKISKPIET